tara:strand:+ start:236 stop:607 length:372 start_codon:yes stop_codon:yes gene_type:complete
MAERYMRYAVNCLAGVDTTIMTAEPSDDASPVAADSVIIGFYLASTSTESSELTITLTRYQDAVVVKLADTIPLPADTSIDLIPGKMILQHGPRNSDDVLTGDIIKVLSTKTCSVVLSVIERV